MFSRKLVLAKTHDWCAVKKPRLTVVMIHGIAADSSSFTRALEYLEGTRSLKDIRFVTFDLLGAGKSLKSDDLQYTYKEQVEALHNAIIKLKLDTPLVLVGHSMGALIAMRYADTHKKTVRRLILISPPIYTEAEIANPAFKVGMRVFRDAASVKNHKILEDKSFEASINNIVSDKRNYKIFSELKTPATMIYGDKDRFISAHNIPRILGVNPKYLTAIKTDGFHGVSRDKYSKMVGVLEEVLNG